MVECSIIAFWSWCGCRGVLGVGLSMSIFPEKLDPEISDCPQIAADVRLREEPDEEEDEDEQDDKDDNDEGDDDEGYSE